MSMIKNENLLITKRKDGSRRVRRKTVGKTRVKASFQNESNINTIVKKYNPKLLMQQAIDVSLYNDFSKITDLHSAQNIILEAQQKFNVLPAHIRKAFDNDPQKLVETFQDPKGTEKLIELGLIPRTTTDEDTKPTPKEEPNPPEAKTES